MIALQLAPLVMMTALYAACVKMAGRVIRSSTVQWRHAIVFSLIVVTVVLFGRFLDAIGVAPHPAGSFAGVGLHIVLGSWFFRNRATTLNGLSVGAVRASLITLTALAMLLSTAGAIAGVFYVFSART